MPILILLFLILVFGLGIGMWFKSEIIQWLNTMGSKTDEKNDDKTEG